MPPIRVIVVDDSAVVRRVLCDALSADPSIQVVATAADGRIALSKISQEKPDLVTLDVEMPVMDGLQALAAIRKIHPRLPVIMFSTLTERGASATLDALALGASDYATKPSNAGSPAAATARVRSELIPKIKALCGVFVPATPAVHPAPPAAAAVLKRLGVPPRIDALAIGTSTGGPNALAVVLRSLPADLSVPLVIVQHMPPIFTRLLAERLSASSRIRVREAESGQPLEPGVAWVAPGDYHMVVQRQGDVIRIALNQGPKESSCRPAVDVLFRSVAQVYGPHILGVVMTGMGADGVIGSQHIRAGGGEVIVQDEATSVVWGMPGLVVAAGQADAIYPLDQLGAEVIRRVQRNHPLLGSAPVTERQGSFS